MNPVAITGLLVAAIRAEESRRSDRLFEDPFADALAGDAGRAILVKYRDSAPPPAVPVIEVRTYWYDQAVARALEGGIRQVVLLAAGMDSRAFRLDWPAGTRVFELDQASVIDHKQAALRSATPRCTRIALKQDLADDWSPQLEHAGFNPKLQTCWFVEGLLQYLEPTAVASIFTRIEALSAPGSVTLYDVIGTSLLTSPFLASTLQMMRDLGAPWLFGSDAPASLLPSWRANVTEPAIVGNALERWPFPAAPPGVPGIPRGYLIEAIKP